MVFRADRIVETPGESEGVANLMAEPNRVPLTIRLRPDDKDAFVAAADRAGIEPGIAARTIMEMVIRRIHEGQTFFQAVGELERALNDEKSKAA